MHSDTLIFVHYWSVIMLLTVRIVNATEHSLIVTLWPGQSRKTSKPAYSIIEWKITLKI